MSFGQRATRTRKNTKHIVTIVGKSSHPEAVRSTIEEGFKVRLVWCGEKRLLRLKGRKLAGLPFSAFLITLFRDGIPHLLLDVG